MTVGDQEKAAIQATSRLHRLAKLGAVLTVLILVLGSVYGRTLERRYGELIPLIPVLALVFVLVATISTARYVRKKSLSSGLKVDWKRMPRVLLLAIVGGAALIGFCESMIVAPIERIHFLKFGVLSFFLYFSQTQGSKGKKLLFAALSAALFGVAEETLQYFVPDRIFDPRDIVLNISAAFAGSGFVWLMMQWKDVLAPRELASTIVRSQGA